MQVDGRLPIRQRYGEVVIHSLLQSSGSLEALLTALFISFFEGGMFSRWIVTNITFARGTLHCSKSSIPCGNQPVI
jgi:hypothetical protein